ncbi:unannotated protein [freshwater metagenome]|uniref:Unannotated protein n=1 Tax=freshwater metagenome TaxID=449393 RepID=A0A6J6PMG3_9ZZZZ
MTKSAGLAGHAATVDVADDVVNLVGARNTKRFGEDHAMRFGREVVSDRTLVHSDGA